MPEDDIEDEERTDVGIEPLPAPAREARGRPYLLVLAGPNVGEMYPLDLPEMLVGRASDATTTLCDNGISRRHMRIVIEGTAVRIEDLGSANGTILNGERVAAVATLRDGDKIQLGTTILKFSYRDDLEEEFQREMYDAALRDYLTKAFNKRLLLDRLGAEFAFARRHQTALALTMLDIDHFKRVNDTFGHLAGDHVLAKLAARVTSVLRKEDLFARYGGEEFAILCRGTTPTQASIVAERVRSTVERTEFVHEGRAIPVTASLGVVGYPSFDAAGPAQLIDAADNALYEAKRAGRNRCVVRRGS